MIIKSHVRGGYRAAADYLKKFGRNEEIRLVEISDPDASNLDEAFHNMWTVASNTRCKKPLHHISINPYWDERLTDEQVFKIAARCEKKYGYKPGEHQRVIVEHILDGRQHFHVMWNRVSLVTGRPVWPGHHWNKSKQAAREMERELGLKRPMNRFVRRMLNTLIRTGRIRPIGRYQTASTMGGGYITPIRPRRHPMLPARPSPRPPPYPLPYWLRRRGKKDENTPDSEKIPFRRPEWESMELLAWAWETRNGSTLALFGIYLPPDDAGGGYDPGVEP